METLSSTIHPIRASTQSIRPRGRLARDNVASILLRGRGARWGYQRPYLYRMMYRLTLSFRSKGFPTKGQRHEQDHELAPPNCSKLLASAADAIASLQRKIIAVSVALAGDRLSVLCLGAHSGDTEIGVGATLLSMMLAAQQES